VRIAMVLYRYFPYGGLQRDFLRIAKALSERGHTIEVLTLSWQGDVPDFLNVNIINVLALANYRRYARFANKVAQKIQHEKYDAVVGFNKMVGLDFYYAADPCFAASVAQQRYVNIYRYVPRYRYFYAVENAVFSPDSATQIFLIAPQEKNKFVHYYCTPTQRFHLLPPGIQKDRLRPQEAEKIRENKRQQLGIAPDKLVVLMIGSGFKTKGVDRALYALASLAELLKQKVQLFLIGQDRPKKFLRLAKKLAMEEQFVVFNGRDDVPEFLLAADLLIHPAYRENTGTVLLEALCAGLPVLATDVCGYAHYIEKADAGYVVPSPFSQEVLNGALLQMLTNETARQQWSNNGVMFSQNNDLYSLPQHAAEIIEKGMRESQ